MNKFNLNTNDIIIILVIFIVFCIFIYVNNYYTTEQFQVAIKHKNNEEIIIVYFITKLKEYIKIIDKLNTTFYELLDFFKKNNYNYDTIFNDTELIKPLNNIKNILNEMRDIDFIKNEKNVFNDFFDIHNDYIFNEYTVLFNRLGTTVAGTTLAGTTVAGTTVAGTTVAGTTVAGTTVAGTTVAGNQDSNNIYTRNINFFTNIQTVKNYYLDKLDAKIDIIDIYFKNFKSIDKFSNIMDIFKDYRIILINIFNNFNEIKNIITTLIEPYDSDNGLYKNHNIIIRQFRNTKNIIDDLISLLDEYTDSGRSSNQFVDPPLYYNTDETTNLSNNLSNNLEFETKFCEKLQKLNKPDKSNLIFKRFTNNIIQKKFKFVKKLEDKIRLIQDQMTEKELNDFNLNRLRTDDHAKKQHTAIKQAINNIKNRNKIKINLS